ncbi:MAG TPA: NAD(P)H-binding protein [Panacibacter sp.]|nr:NAD(P)H-binding protein [Panacibacter sp.]
MILTVFGATGRVGKRIVRMALAQGHIVRAFGRNIENLLDEDLHNNKFEAIKGYVFDEHEVFNAVEGCGAVLSALGGDFKNIDKTRSLGIKNIVAQMEKAAVKRIIAVGGAGTLKDDEYEFRLNRPGYPAVFKAVSTEHLEAYGYLKTSDLDWTFVCPPDIKDGDASGKYIAKADYRPEPYINNITTGDIADFMLQELTARQYINKRVGICTKG